KRLFCVRSMMQAGKDYYRQKDQCHKGSQQQSLEIQGYLNSGCGIAQVFAQLLGSSNLRIRVHESRRDDRLSR
ncbi:MAG: hypothetical protein ACREA4_00460, partial [Nitrososphaera sp.]